MRHASSRPVEHRSRSFQLGPVGQCECTNAAKGGGWCHLRSYTSELCGNLVEIKASLLSGTWLLVLDLRLHRPLVNKGASWLPYQAPGVFWLWLCATSCCPSAVAAPEWLKMPRKVMPSLLLQPLPPNPSIEGMPKRLRLLCTPHVKR